MPYIELTQGQKTKVNQKTFIAHGKKKWCFTNGYAARRSPQSGSHEYLHRVIVNCPDNMMVTHKDGNKLNNLTSNLEIVSRSQRSQAVAPRAASGKKGVTFHHGKWIAQISINGKNKHLGRFSSLEEAGRSYDDAAKRHYGKAAKLNEHSSCAMVNGQKDQVRDGAQKQYCKNVVLTEHQGRMICSAVQEFVKRQSNLDEKDSGALALVVLQLLP